MVLKLYWNKQKSVIFKADDADYAWNTGALALLRTNHNYLKVSISS